MVKVKTKGGVFRGDRLRHLRMDTGMTLLALSKHVGISQASLNRIELNQQEPALRTAKKIANVFGVGLDWLTER